VDPGVVGSIPTSRPSESSRRDHLTAKAEPAQQAARTPQRIYLGTSGWAYPSWKPGFYPAGTRASKMLGWYASQLNSVEVNYTFRQMPTAAMVAEWMTETPESFRFSFKAPQRMTHFSRLRNCAASLTELRKSLADVVSAGRFGVLLLQLPPNFRADGERLNGFLRDAGELGLPMAFEFRDSSWFTGETYEILERHGAALCIAESDELKTPEHFTAEFSYFRLRKSVYSGPSLKNVAARLRASAAKGDVYAYFKHEEAPDGPLRARSVLRAVRR
jgi:uncharacterized protein YecE (DUF72 family)